MANVEVAAHVRFQNFPEFVVEVVGVGLFHVAEKNFGLKRRGVANDLNRARADVAKIYAQAVVVGKHFVDGKPKFHRIGDAANLVQRLHEKMRRHKIFTRKKFPLALAQIKHRRKLIGIVAVQVSNLPPVDALQNFRLVGRKSQRSFHNAPPPKNFFKFSRRETVGQA